MFPSCFENDKKLFYNDFFSPKNSLFLQRLQHVYEWIIFSLLNTNSGPESNPNVSINFLNTELLLSWNKILEELKLEDVIETAYEERGKGRWVKLDRLREVR